MHILRETARAEKAEPAPAPHILPYLSPQPTPPCGYQPAGTRSPAPNALVWPAARPAPQQIKNPKPARRRALMPMLWQLIYAYCNYIYHSLWHEYGYVCNMLLNLKNVNNNNNNFLCANILENQAQWRDKTKGLSNCVNVEQCVSR